MKVENLSGSITKILLIFEDGTEREERVYRYKQKEYENLEKIIILE